MDLESFQTQKPSSSGSTTSETIMLPFIAAALPALIEAVPSLISIFGNSPQAEKNAKAAQIVVNAAKAATGSTNEQELVEKLESKDPEVIAAVHTAVQDVWYELQINSEGIEAARGASIQVAGEFWKQPAIWVTASLLPMVYIVVLTVLGIMGKNDFATEIKIMVVSAVISGVLGAITGFWLGTSFSSSRKTELLQK